MIIKREIQFKNKIYTVEANDLSECAYITVNGENADKIYYNSKRAFWFSQFSLQGNDFWVIVKKNQIFLVPCVSGKEEADFIYDYATRAYGGLAEFLFSVFGIIFPCTAILIIAYTYNVDISEKIGAGIAVVSYYWFVICNNSLKFSHQKRRKLCFLVLLGPLACLALFGIGLLI